ALPRPTTTRVDGFPVESRLAGTYRIKQKGPPPMGTAPFSFCRRDLLSRAPVADRHLAGIHLNLDLPRLRMLCLRHRYQQQTVLIDRFNAGRIHGRAQPQRAAKLRRAELLPDWFGV